MDAYPVYQAALAAVGIDPKKATIRYDELQAVRHVFREMDKVLTEKMDEIVLEGGNVSPTAGNAGPTYVSELKNESPPELKR